MDSFPCFNAVQFIYIQFYYREYIFSCRAESGNDKQRANHYRLRVPSALECLQQTMAGFARHNRLHSISDAGSRIQLEANNILNNKYIPFILFTSFVICHQLLFRNLRNKIDNSYIVYACFSFYKNNLRQLLLIAFTLHLRICLPQLIGTYPYLNKRQFKCILF